jgi:hypothetical protein
MVVGGKNMSDPTVRSIKNALAGGSVRYQVWPDAAAGAPVVNIAGAPENVAWVWSQTATSQNIIAAANIPSPCWLVGFTIVQCTWAAATTYGDIQFCSGALAAEVWLAIVPVLAGVETAIGLGGKAPIYFPYPIKLVGSPRIGARIRNATAGIATGLVVKVITATGLD